MLDNLGKKILLLFFKGIINLEKNEEIGFDKWKGEITKNNISINKNILQYFQLDLGIPLKFIDGIIETLKINIPWQKIRNEKIMIELENFILILKIDYKDFRNYFFQSEELKKKKIMKKIEKFILQNFQNKGVAGYIENSIMKNITLLIKNLKIIFYFEDIKFHFFTITIGHIKYNINQQ